jgi:hypothetical protein
MPHEALSIHAAGKRPQRKPGPCGLGKAARKTL